MRKLRVAGGALVATILVSGLVWYSQLSPYQRCWTDECREKAFDAELDRIEDEWRPRIEATTRDVEDADRRVANQQQRLNEIDQAIASVECRKKGRVC